MLFCAVFSELVIIVFKEIKLMFNLSLLFKYTNYYTLIFLSEKPIHTD